ncbi:MAG: glycosyltransferase [Desulfamplus sp.]|nr:glycosyltransferase [Desulfamplus sp.]
MEKGIDVLNKNNKKKYKPSDLVFIVPTKDRPGKITRLLGSFTRQSVMCGRIIIIDGGESIEGIVKNFKNALPVEYYRCVPPGQIRQRNMGISLLDDKTKLVGSLDDDIVLEPNAVAEMINCWNFKVRETAGIAFNIINIEKVDKGFFRRLFLYSSLKPGQVLISGATTQICPTDHDIKSQWLCGGATVWRLEILNKFQHREIKSRWAITEDLIFSYPIGKEFPLYVCANAHVKHEHVHDFTKNRLHQFVGKSTSLWRFYFVMSNSGVYLYAYLWMSVGIISFKLIQGMFCKKIDSLKFAIGYMDGLWLGIKSIIGKKSIIDLLEKET